jgi:hypothetical protein
MRFYDKDTFTLRCTELLIRLNCPRKLDMVSKMVEELPRISIRSERNSTRRTSTDTSSNLLPVTIGFHSVSDIGSHLKEGLLCREATDGTWKLVSKEGPGMKHKGLYLKRCEGRHIQIWSSSTTTKT